MNVGSQVKLLVAIKGNKDGNSVLLPVGTPGTLVKRFADGLFYFVSDLGVSCVYANEVKKV